MIMRKITKIMLATLLLTTWVTSTFANDVNLISIEDISNDNEINQVIELTENTDKINVDEETVEKDLQELYNIFEKIYHE